MPYLGNTPTANFATVTKDTFSGNASTTAFTLSKTATTNGVAVYVENVRQIPTTAYAISGTTLTFTGAPPSGTNNIYVMHHNTPVSTATHPAAQALTATSGTFTSNIDVDGTANLDAVDIDGAVDMASTLAVAGVSSLTNKLTLTAADGVADNDYIMDIQNAEATDGRNFGLRIKAGSNASDYGFVLADHDGTNTRIISYGNGYTAFLANAASNNAFKIANDGNNNNRYGLEVHCGADDASGTNYAITFHDGDGTAQGIITFSSGTVTYGAFTAHHEISLPDADKSDGYNYGTLVEIDDIYYTQKNGADTERGIRYLVKKSQGAYSKKVLGAYCGDMLLRADTDGTYKDNLHQCAILGDGHIICNGEKGNISIGDGICSSSTNGIGMKADKLSMIIGIAQKDITFSSASETKLVPVQYGVRQFTPWTD